MRISRQPVKIPLSIAALCLLLLPACTHFDRSRKLETAQANRTGFMRLEVGMTPDEVSDVMGEAMYPETITNPYRTEAARLKDGKVVTIWFYYTEYHPKYVGRKLVYGAISNEMLTPLVFVDGKLTGWGRRFFEEEIKRLEIRIR